MQLSFASRRTVQLIITIIVFSVFLIPYTYIKDKEEISFSFFTVINLDTHYNYNTQTCDNVYIYLELLKKRNKKNLEISQAASVDSFLMILVYG